MTKINQMRLPEMEASKYDYKPRRRFTLQQLEIIAKKERAMMAKELRNKSISLFNFSSGDFSDLPNDIAKVTRKTANIVRLAVKKLNAIDPEFREYATFILIKAIKTNLFVNEYRSLNTSSLQDEMLRGIEEEDENNGFN